MSLRTRRLIGAHCAVLMLMPLRTAGVPHALAAPQGTPGAPAADLTLTPEALYARLRVIADDSMEGRRTGTKGLARATTYVVRELVRMGVKPAGLSRGFLQPVPIVSAQLDESRSSFTSELPPYPVSRLVRGIDFEPLPGLLGLPFPRRASVSGRIIQGGRLGAADAIRPESTAGRFVVFEPPLRRDGLADYEVWRAASALAQYPDARALMVVSLDVTPPSFFEHFKVPHLELDTPLPPLVTRPVVAISRNAADLLLESQTAKGYTYRALIPAADPRAAALDFNVRQTDVEIPAQNVAAVIEGTDPALKSEFVVVIAHLDHLGIASIADRVDSDSIFNGADESGTGSAALLSLAEHFAAPGARPKRSLMFLWTVGAEEGLLGSAWFTEHPTVPRGRMVASINIDMIGRGGARDGAEGGPEYLRIVGARRLSSAFGAWIEEVNRRAEFGFHLDGEVDSSAGDVQTYCSGDQWNFARWGIPSALITTGKHADYHTVRDEIERIDYPKYAHVTRFIAALVTDLASRPVRPSIGKVKPDPRALCITAPDSR